jgi:pilin
MKPILVNAIATALAVVLALAAYKWYADREEEKRRQKYVGAAYITQGFSLLSIAKMHVTASYEERGRWPSSNEESGLPPSSDYASDSVSGLSVSEGGVITVTFNEKSGVKDGKLRLTPHAGMDIRWKCTTPSFKEIEKWAPQCTFEG